jgi:hypothetical protein
VTRLINHLKHNVVAYLALFVALGGMSYAAINLPAGSVGTKQLRNGAVTNKKLAKGSVGATDLDHKSIAGYVHDYAHIRFGKLVSARPRARLVAWAQSGLQPGGTIQWKTPIPTTCTTFANTFTIPASYASAQITNPGSKVGGAVEVLVSGQQPADVDVIVACPQP